jgi:hypothetical protein
VSALPLLLQDLSTLAASTALDHESDKSHRVLPIISPVVLWRLLPRILTRAAELGGENSDLTETQREFMVNLADLIQGKIGRKAGVA